MRDSGSTMPHLRLVKGDRTYDLTEQREVRSLAERSRLERTDSDGEGDDRRRDPGLHPAAE